MFLLEEGNLFGKTGSSLSEINTNTIIKMVDGPKQVSYLN